jgi:predicted MFS family arabinose efflux permease
MIRLARRISRVLWGSDLDPALWPVLVVSLLFAASFSTFWTYVGVFALKRLHISGGTIGVLFLLSFAAGIVSAYLGGQLSDRIGRKPVIAVAIAGQSLVALALLPVHGLMLGVVLIVLAAALGAPVQSANNALVADLAGGEREGAYAAVRVASNLGVVIGPPLGGLLLFVGGWSAFLVGIAGLGGLAFFAALRLLPAIRVRAEVHARTRENLPRIIRDVPFALLLLSTFLGFIVYVAWETVLPVVAVDSFHLAPGVWGGLMMINAGIVALFQLRLTRAVENASEAMKLALAMPLMGFSFLLLVVNGSLAMLVVVTIVFVVGEMLWIPTSQSLAARLAPEPIRGAYMGAFTASAGAAWTIGPLVALEIRSVAGNTPVWVAFAAASIAGALAGTLASRAPPALDESVLVPRTNLPEAMERP